MQPASVRIEGDPSSREFSRSPNGFLRPVQTDPRGANAQKKSTNQSRTIRSGRDGQSAPTTHLTFRKKRKVDWLPRRPARVKWNACTARIPHVETVRFERDADGGPFGWAFVRKKKNIKKEIKREHARRIERDRASDARSVGRQRWPCSRGAFGARWIDSLARVARRRKFARLGFEIMAIGIRGGSLGGRGSDAIAGGV